MVRPNAKATSEFTAAGPPVVTEDHIESDASEAMSLRQQIVLEEFARIPVIKAAVRDFGHILL
jgi:hypothetical protein